MADQTEHVTFAENTDFREISDNDFNKMRDEFENDVYLTAANSSPKVAVQFSSDTEDHLITDNEEFNKLRDEFEAEVAEVARAALEQQKANEQVAVQFSTDTRDHISTDHEQFNRVRDEFEAEVAEVARAALEQKHNEQVHFAEGTEDHVQDQKFNARRDEDTCRAENHPIIDEDKDIWFEADVYETARKEIRKTIGTKE